MLRGDRPLTDRDVLALRHYSHSLRLDESDGASAFAADATFHRTAGLAGPSWSSFRSYNVPTRYIRHVGNLLADRPGPHRDGAGRRDLRVRC